MTTNCDIFFKREMTPALLFFWSDFKPPYGNKIFPTKLKLINFLRFRCCISILSFWFGKFLKFTIPFTLAWKSDIYCIQINGYIWRDNLAVLEKIYYNQIIIGISAIWKTVPLSVFADWETQHINRSILSIWFCLMFQWNYSVILLVST